ncbi:MAG TPA: RNA-binding protein [Candidatus Binatia bacterium]|jgi:RNA recognition motif-containing protein|nr:RNA-binding protein [Candidatus Binatia bacterium]
MGNKLYVGGLPYSVTEGRLEEIFAEYGSVQSARVISDKFTGQSRGFGFVEMNSGEEAQKAIDALNGSQLDGRTLVVNEARPQERRPGGGGGMGGGMGGGGNRRGGGGGMGGGGRNRW